MNVLSRLLGALGPAGGRIGRLLAAAVHVIGTDRVLLIPFLLLFLLKAGRAALLLFLLFLGFVTRDWETAFPLMLVAMAYLPVEMILQTFLQAALSRMTYDTLLNGRSSASATLLALLRNLPSLVFIGLVSALVRHVSESRQGGILGFLLALLMFAVREVWDLVSNFGISGIIVENASVRTLVDRLKALRAHVPEALAGVIGIDLLGGALTALFAGGVVLGLFGGGLLGYLYADRLPSAFLVQFDDLQVNTLPSLALLSISFTISAVFQAATVCAKSLYFTVLYVLVVRPQDLPEGRRQDIETVTAGAARGATASA